MLKDSKMTLEQRERVRKAHPKGIQLPTKWRENIRRSLIGNKYNLGNKASEETKRKMSESHRLEKHWAWKGDKAGYDAMHDWISRYYGTPTTCEHCQTSNLTAHKIHWANISDDYKRDRRDWLRLCAKCHNLFDKTKSRREKTRLKKFNAIAKQKMTFLKRELKA